MGGLWVRVDDFGIKEMGLGFGVWGSGFGGWGLGYGTFRWCLFLLSARTLCFFPQLQFCT
jgi:hypothetical protein